MLQRNRACSAHWLRRCSISLLLCFIILLHTGYADFVRSPSVHHWDRTKRSVSPPNSGDRKPPQPPIVYGEDTPESLRQILDQAVADETSVVDQIIKNVTKPQDATFENTILPYAHHEDKISLSIATLTMYSYLSPNKDLRNVSSMSNSVLSESAQKTVLNQDLFDRVNHVYQTHQKNPDPKLNAEDRLYLTKFWKGFEDAGLELPEVDRKHVQKISKKLADLESDFQNAAAEDTTTLWFTREELNGTSPGILDGLEKGNGTNESKLKISLASPDTREISSRATNATVRQLIAFARGQMAPSNVGTLEEAVKLRDERARILNYTSFAEVKIKGNVAKTPKAVDDFLQAFRPKLDGNSQLELAHLKELKKQETGNAEHLFRWDAGYYQRVSVDTEYKLDSEKVKEWFPADFTMQEILKLYEELFGLKFVAITGKDLDQLSLTGKGEDLVWAPNVTVYSVWENGPDGSQGDFVGYLSIDLYYREGKDGGAFMIPLTPGHTLPDGTRYYPSVALATNFVQTSTSKPQLLRHDDVQTILHEFGHCIHSLVSKTKYGRFHGPNGTPRDWGEMPSQLMENWAYVPAVLKRLSKHWSYLSPESLAAWKKEQKDENTKQPCEQLPDDTIEKILKVKNAYSSYSVLQQVFLSAYDMSLHEQPSASAASMVDSTTLYNTQLKEYTKVDGPEVLGKGFKWGHPQTTFTHIMSGYDAGYYSYLWSNMYAKDVFYTAFKQDPFSSTTGARWRQTILAPGGTKDYDEILEAFLGHKPSIEAYFEDLKKT